MEKKSQSKAVLSISIIVLSIIVFFIFSITRRQDKFGILFNNTHYSTGSTVVFTNNWLDGGGILQMNFCLYENPKSIETESDHSKYFSYPPGAVIPIYVICKVLKSRATPQIVMGFNLFTQFIIALIVAFITLFSLKKIHFGYWTAVALSVLGGFAYLNIKILLFWHQNYYFADQAILPLFALLLLLELGKDHTANKLYVKLINNFISTVLFLGLLTDWLFISVFLCLFLKRMITGEISIKSFKSFVQSSLKIVVPIIFALALFILQIFVNDGFEILYERFKLRTSILGTSGSITDQLYNRIEWVIYIYQFYGAANFLLFVILFLISICLIYLILKNGYYKLNNELKLIFNILLITLIPCLLHNILLNNHSKVHKFSVMKFAIPFTLTYIIILPILLKQLLKKLIKRFVRLAFVLQKKWNPIFFITFCLVILFFINQTKYVTLYNVQKDMSTFNTFGNFIQKNTNFKSVIFSDCYKVYNNPPHQIAFTNKLIYHNNEMVKFSSIKGADFLVLSSRDIAETNIKKIDSISLSKADIFNMQDFLLSMEIRITNENLPFKNIFEKMGNSDKLYLYSSANKQLLYTIFKTNK